MYFLLLGLLSIVEIVTCSDYYYCVEIVSSINPFAAVGQPSLTEPWVNVSIEFDPTSGDNLTDLSYATNYKELTYLGLHCLMHRQNSCI